MADDIEKLAQGMVQLPQELYDQIYDLTFTAEPGERKISDLIEEACGILSLIHAADPFRGHDSSNLFLVNRASSHKFAMSYYGGEGAVFTFRGIYSGFEAWYKSLHAEHRAMIRDVRLVTSYKVLVCAIRSLIESRYGSQIVGRIRIGCEKSVLGDLVEYEGQVLSDYSSL